MKAGWKCYRSEAGEIFNVTNGPLKIELQRELDQTRIVACRRNASEIARVDNVSGVSTNNCGVEITVRITQVHLIEKIKKLGAELDALGFAKFEAPDHGEVQVHLLGSTKDITDNITYVRALCASECNTV